MARLFPGFRPGAGKRQCPIPIEALEDRIAPAFVGTYSGPDAQRTLTLDGTAEADVASFDFIQTTQSATLQVTNSGPNTGTQSFDLQNVRSIVVNGQAGDDVITVNFGDALPSGIEFLSVDLGEGDDQLAVTGAFNSRITSFDAYGGTGANTVAVLADHSMTLTDDYLVAGAQAIYLHKSFTVAKLTGGPSNNSFSLQNWTGSASIDGSSGSDTLTVSGSATHTYTLSNGGYAPAGYPKLAAGIYRDTAGTITPSGIEKVSVSGGPDPTIFDVSRWNANLTVIGNSGHDTVLDYSGVSISLSDRGLTRTDKTTVSIPGIANADLRSTGKGATFSFIDWHGTVSVTGGAGTSTTVTVTADAALFTLTDSSLSYTGHGLIMLQNVGAAVLTGGSGDNTFDLSNWHGTATVAGSSGNDTLTQSGDGFDSYTLTSTQLLRSTVGVHYDYSFSGIEQATITAAQGASSLILSSAVVNGKTIPGFAGGVVYNGQGGNDTLILRGGASGSVTFNGSGGNDAINVIGNSATWLPSSTTAGAGELRTGANCDYHDVPGVIQISAWTITVQPSAGANDYTISGFDITSASPVQHATFDANNHSLIIDLGASDSGAVPDSLTIKLLAPSPSGGLLDVRLGDGDDSLTFTPGGYFYRETTVEAGGGVDTLDIQPISLSVLYLEGALRPDGPGELFGNFGLGFTGLENIHLRGTAATKIIGTGHEIATWTSALTPGVSSTISMVNGATTSTILMDMALAYIADVDSLTVKTPIGADVVTLDHVDTAQGRIVRETGTGTLSGTRFASVKHLTLDFSAGIVGSVAPADSFTLGALAGITGLASLVVKTGNGNDTFTIDSSVTTFGLPAQGDGLTFDPGLGANRLVDQAGASQTLHLAGRLDFDGSGFALLTAGFQTFEFHSPVTIEGTGAEYAVWSPDQMSSNAGSIVVRDAAASAANAPSLATISYAGTLAFTRLASLELQTGVGAASFTLDGTGGAGILSGTVNGGAVAHVASFAYVRSVTLDLSRSDSAASVDVNSLAAVGLQNLTIVTGAGDDVLRLLPMLTSLELPVPGGQFSYDGGAGVNTLEASADVSMTLQDGQLTYSGNDALQPFQGSLNFLKGQIQQAHLTGGAGDNIFHVVWPYQATLDGLGGNDTFDLSAFTGHGSVNGGEGDDLFLLQATSRSPLDGAGSGVHLDGGAGHDTISAGGDFNFTLTDSALVRALPKTREHGAESVTNAIASIEAATLSGGGSANVLNAGAFSGTATLIGGDGIDTLIASKGGGALYGYTNAPEPGGFHIDTRDNYYLSDGTVDGAVDTIYATSRLGNLVSFRYYHGGTGKGVHFIQPDSANGHEQLVTAKGAPELHVALATGRLNLLEGSQHADQLFGNKLANILSGLGGDDLLSGTGGDILAGGAGHDRFVGFTPYRYQDLTFAFPGAVVIPELSRAAATTAASSHTIAAVGSIASSVRPEFAWLDPVATIIASAA